MIPRPIPGNTLAWTTDGEAVPCRCTGETQTRPSCVRCIPSGQKHGNRHQRFNVPTTWQLPTFRDFSELLFFDVMGSFKLWIGDVANIALPRNSMHFGTYPFVLFRTNAQSFAGSSRSRRTTRSCAWVNTNYLRFGALVLVQSSEISIPQSFAIFDTSSMLR